MPVKPITKEQRERLNIGHNIKPAGNDQRNDIDINNSGNDSTIHVNINAEEKTTNQNDIKLSGEQVTHDNKNLESDDQQQSDDTEGQPLKDKGDKHVSVDQCEQETDEFDDSGFEVLDGNKYSNESRSHGIITLVRKLKSSMRMEIANEAMKKLGFPKAVQIKISDCAIAISAAEFGSPKSYKVNSLGKKGVIYSAEFINTSISRYNLDFSNRVSITFGDYEFKTKNDKVVLVIKMK